MAQPQWALSISALMVIAGLKVVVPAAAIESAPVATAQNPHTCAGSPSDAVMALPPPLNRWGQIVCTPYGHMLASHSGWMWIMPDDFETVLIPAQIPEKEPQQLGNKVYFTDINVYRIKGSEFNDVYKVFHAGFDDGEVKPDGYRVEMKTVEGKTILMYFFDYDTYAWGISCPENRCETDTRFLMLDKNTPPKPLAPPI